MLVNDLIREKVLVEIISNRDAMILELHAENENLKRQLADIAKGTAPKDPPVPPVRLVE